MSSNTEVRAPSSSLALLVIASATLMITLDATIVNVAMPSIRGGLGFTPAGVEWVIASYSLAFGGLLLLGGRAGDLFGRRRMFMAGIALFSAASLVGGFAMTGGWLLAARALQGVGAAVAAPTALSLIATTFPAGAARGRAMAVYAAMSSSGGVLGMILGGVLTDVLSWRWVLFVNVPIGALILVLAPRALAAGPGDRRGGLDLPGALTATLGMTSLVYGLVQATERSWGSAVVPLAAAVVLLAAFAVIESRVANPVLPLAILADRNRAGAYLITLAVGLGMYGVTFFLMLHLQGVLGFGPLRAGLAFLPLVAGIGMAAFAMGRLVGRIGYQPGVTFGPLVAAVGALWLWQATPGFASLVAPMVVLGLGLGAAVVPLTLTAVSSVRPAEAGVASALVGAGQQVGGSLGLAVLGLAVEGGGYGRAFLVGGAALLAAFLLAVAVIRGGTARRPAP